MAPHIHLPDIHLPHMRWAVKDRYLYVALLAEFLGTALLQLLGGVTNSPLQVAFTLTAIMYATKYISGGHLNPAVSLAATLSGHIDYIRGFSYIVAQFVGAIVGALIQAWISPERAVGETGPGCFEPVVDMSNWGVWGWETVLTFVFIVVMYASVFVQPGHGDAAPLAAGLATFAALSTGGSYTGLSPLNPARNFAGSLVYKCFWRWTFVYIAGQLTAAVLAAGWALLVFGKGVFYQHDGSNGTLREGLLGNTHHGMEPAGPTFAPMGHHYAGSVVANEQRHGRSEGTIPSQP